MRDWGKLLAWALLLAALGLIPMAIGWSGLPDPVAVHWGSDGQPDGQMSKGLVWMLPLLLVGLGFLLTFPMRVNGRPSAEAMGFLGILGGVGIWVSISIVTLNHEASTWEQAGRFDLWQVVGVIGSALGIGWVSYVLGKRWYPVARKPVFEDPPVLELRDQEVAVWTGSANATWPFLVLSPIAVVFLFLPGWFKAFAPIYLALAYLFSQVSVSVDQSGIRVRLAGLITVTSIALADVAGARPIDLEPSEWGGWGYRVMPGKTAVVLRRGDAMEVVRTDDRRFAVTVEDAATGAGLLNGLVKRRERSR